MEALRSSIKPTIARWVGDRLNAARWAGDKMHFFGTTYDVDASGRMSFSISSDLNGNGESTDARNDPNYVAGKEPRLRLLITGQPPFGPLPFLRSDSVCEHCEHSRRKEVQTMALPSYQDAAFLFVSPVSSASVFHTKLNTVGRIRSSL